MPTWLLSALNLIRSGLVGTPSRALVTGAGGGLAATAAAEEGGGFLPSFPFFGPGAPKRHRRRKALTADDLRLSLIIASSISKKAAENFILSRVRAG